MQRLKDKVALVTGAASGIGKAIARLFLEEGAAVVLADIDAARLAEVVAAFAPVGPVTSVQGDVASMADAARMVETAERAFGGLDILVCNAAIPSVMPIEEIDEAEFDRVLSVNMKGVFTLVRQAISPMKARGGGRIVTLGSELGIVAVPESPAYCASKGAVIMFTKAIAIDLIRHNIRVNALCPGITQTPLLEAEVTNSQEPEAVKAAQAVWAPIMRIADPAEIAKGALFLASDESSFAVGSCLVVDGGYTAR